MSADRNLLFGILALQLDFIKKDALIQAMQAWVFDKGTSLGQLLVKQGALRQEQQALLDGLVAAHLAQHGNDPRESLAALSARPVELAQIADPDLQASLGQVAADDFATRAASVGESTSAGVRFRILRPHARGGLGEVFVAEDAELKREIALKQIQDRHADDPGSRSRFILEAQITGGLEHPGIVPVYGLGQYADGRPFYAMRFIRGNTLGEAIERFHSTPETKHNRAERAVEFRKLLGRFLDVCNAIAYAHSRGVLHRDLKPGNIMLGKYGETLVVDWGLAKAAVTTAGTDAAEAPLQPSIESGAAETVAGSAIGTPQFMSPEQAAGRLDLLGPATDVYALGATLYVLLTGKPPIGARDVGQVLRKAQHGDFPPPRQHKRDVPRGLEAICLKAMALEPKDRYPTPRALAADVESWLADEAVSVFREPLTARLGRWARRHRALVTTTALAGLAVLVVLTSMAALWLGELAGRQRQARETGLQLSARYAARTVGNEIDLRWRILELEAKDQNLVELLEQPDGPEVRDKLNSWGKERFYKHDRTARADEWLIADDKGAIRAVFTANLSDAERKKMVGDNVAHRDYFHGKGYDLEPEEAKSARPLTEVHRSTVFLGRFDHKLKVAFSVPIKDRDLVVGVLIMVVELSHFAVLQDELGQNRVAVLVDTKPDVIEGAKSYGLILDHQQTQGHGVAGLRKFYRLGKTQVERLSELRSLRLSEDNEANPQHSVPDLYRDYLDPASRGSWLAAAEPVIVTGRRGQVRDTGWIVIVQERE